MRGITYGEKQKIKTQSLTRIAGCCEIAFEVQYYAYYDPAGSDNISNGVLGSPATQIWYEEGFVGDFSLSRKQSSPNWDSGAAFAANQFPLVNAGGAKLDVKLDKAGNVKSVSGTGYATARSLVYHQAQYEYASSTEWLSQITIPVEYVEGFLTSQGTNGKNRLFKPTVMPAGFMTHDTIYCDKVWIKTLNGEPFPADMPNVFTIQAEPKITMDGAVLDLVATSQRGYYTSLGYFPPRGANDGGDGGFYPNRPGAGVVDATGYLSDRKDSTFTYLTTGNLRRYR